MANNGRIHLSKLNSIYHRRVPTQQPPIMANTINIMNNMLINYVRIKVRKVRNRGRLDVYARVNTRTVMRIGLSDPVHEPANECI
jgi:hypothetical protein